MSQRIRTNCPRDCYDGCGIMVEVGDDRLRVLGDDDHPVSRGALCSKCAVAYNGVFQDPAARLLTPLRRVGSKGSGRFEAISWDEALEIVAQRFNSIIDQQGADAIVTLSYSGTLSLIAHFFPDRWANAVGTTAVNYDTICNAAGGVAWHLLFGTAYQGFDPRTVKDAACVLVWGANPSHSAPHAHDALFRDGTAATIVVDPVRTESAAAATMHLQPRPGTDAALAFAMLNAARAGGGFDETYIQAHTLGYDEIEALINSATPAWGAQITGVPAADIVRAAQLYSGGPSLLWCGQSLQRQSLGGNVMRAVGLLPALTGNIGRPGTGFYYLNYTPAFAGVDLSYLSGEPDQPRTVISALDLADHLLDSQKASAFIVWNANPLASCANPQLLRAACSREDLFTVAIDLFETDTVRYADIVLPAASFLEFDDMTFSYFNLIMGAQSAVSAPMGQSLPNQEIFRRLSGVMGLQNPALFETDEAILDQVLQQCGVGFDFSALQQRGHFTLGDEALVFFADGRFDTPSGRIEIASDQAQAMGLPRTPLPDVDPPPANDELRLISPASRWRLNDSYANDAHLAAQAGMAELLINAADAAQRRIEPGQVVEVSNDQGSMKLIAKVDDRVLPGTVLCYKGRWPSLEPGGANVNTLYAGPKSDMGESTTIHGLHVLVAPCSEGE